MKNILIGVDFDDQTDRLIETGISLGKGMGAKIWLLHAAAPDPDFVGYAVGPQYIRDSRAEELREEHRELAKLVERLEQEGVSADGLMISGATVEVIIEESQKLGIDLIITGHHDRGLIHKAFFGSVAMDIVRASNVPVMVVPFGKE